MGSRAAVGMRAGPGSGATSVCRRVLNTALHVSEITPRDQQRALATSSLHPYATTSHPKGVVAAADGHGPTPRRRHGGLWRMAAGDRPRNFKERRVSRAPWVRPRIQNPTTLPGAILLLGRQAANPTLRSWRPANA
jgi:hypothetical protein